MKTRQDNDVTNQTGVVYTEIGIELSWLIEQDVVYWEKHIGQRCDWSYKCDLHRIWY